MPGVPNISHDESVFPTLRVVPLAGLPGRLMHEELLVELGVVEDRNSASLVDLAHHLDDQSGRHIGLSALFPVSHGNVVAFGR